MFVVRRLRVDEQECQKAQAEQRQEPTDGDGSDHQGTVAAGERLRMVPRSGGRPTAAHADPVGRRCHHIR